jgi:hypothetical protein
MAMSTALLFHIFLILCLLVVGSTLWAAQLIRGWLIVVGEVEMEEREVSIFAF